MPKAYSYLRFSTPEQLQGDSFRRQTELAHRYAIQHGLELDTSLTFHDLGVSAFMGKNAGADGQLGAFLEAIRNGVVQQGSYLLVESLDRISRQTARKALRQLEDVVEAGAVVVTLIDGRRYDQNSLDSDPTSLLISILTFMRSHEESATKASRLKAAWSQKRELASNELKPMTRSCPAWLTIGQESGEFECIPERVQVVQRIFEMALEGSGQQLIAQTLNADEVPTFRGGKLWHRTYIAKLLENPAVQGIFVPHVQEHVGGKRVRRSLAPIHGYFPEIIGIETIQRLAAMHDVSVQPRRGRHAKHPLSNLIGGLGRCIHCNSTMTMTNKGSNYRYFICTRAKAGAGCSYRSTPYNLVEDRIMSCHDELLNTAPETSAEETRVRENIRVLQDQKSWLDETINTLIQAVENRASTPATLLERISHLELERINVNQEIDVLTLKEHSLAGSMLSHRIRTLRELLSGPTVDKTRANAVFRLLFSAIYLNPEQGMLEFQWHHSKHRTLVAYRPNDGAFRSPILSKTVPAVMPLAPPVPTVYRTD